MNENLTSTELCGKCSKPKGNTEECCKCGYSEKVSNLFKVFCPKNRYSSEGKMGDLIESNIVDFCRDYLHEELEEYTREYRLGDYEAPKFGVVRPRTDFLIKTKSGKSIAIECKNSTRLQDFAQGITQLLIYKEIENFDRLVLITSNFSHIPYKVIDRYKLPIEVILLNSDSIAYNG